ncbi:hypothetical protein CR513_62572, partial [Mucuna pruriens]
MVKSSVLNEEMRRKTQGSSSQSEVLVTKNKGRSQKKIQECGVSLLSQNRAYTEKKENKGKKGKSKEKDYDDDDDHVTTTASDDFIILRDFDGATLHITLRKKFFTSYTSSDFGVLKMGNDGMTKVIGVGDICLQTNTRIGVKHALDVHFNMIFVHMLDDGSYFGYGKWKLTKEAAKDSVNVMDIEASLWHRRLSHISEKGLTCLAKKDMLPGLKNAELEKCSHCMAGKQTRVSFKKHPPSRKSELLELVHSEVCGPLKIKSFSGALYFVYVLKTKDQVLEKFKQFQALVERQLGKKVKYIRSDNGGEYCGPFDVYCRQQGIRHEKTPPKTPRLNGLAERMNKTLIERVRCMLSEARLPKHFL